MSRTEADRTSPVPMRSSGMLPTPASAKRRGDAFVSRCPDTRHVPVVDSTQPGEHFGELGLAVAGHAGDAQDLATSHRQAHVAQRGQAA